jgi:rhodanese-related sulfurtransferase
MPDDQPIYVICAVGNRSARAAEALRRAGYDAINVAGGTNKWVEEGRPFESGE